MVSVEEGRTHLLRGPIGNSRSDDESVEMIFDAAFSISGDDIHDVPNPQVQRSRIIQRIREKMARVASLRVKKNSFDKVESDNKENINTQVTANLSSYDERSVLESRDGPPLEETESEVSSVLSSISNNKRQKRMISYWKRMMSSSVRKLLRAELEDEMKGKSVPYANIDELYVDPEGSRKSTSRDRRKSTFEDLFVPNLETPSQSYDGSNTAKYSPGNDFPLKTMDEIAMKEVVRENEEHADPNSQFPTPRRRKSGLFVAFDEDMAQIIFHASSSETEDFQAVEVQSVESDIDELSDKDDHFRITYPAYNVGAKFSHPGMPPIVPSASNETEGSPKPLGVGCGHPNWYSFQKIREQEHADVWSRIEAPILDGEVTNPPTPIAINRSRDDYWCLGQADSADSEVTMTDVLLNKHGEFPGDFPSSLPLDIPDIPFARDLLERYPYDEAADRAQRERVVQRRPEQANTYSMEHYLQRGALTAFAVDRDQQHRISFRDRALQENIQCKCVKCTAKSIYQDLLNCNGGTVD